MTKGSARWLERGARARTHEFQVKRAEILRVLNELDVGQVPERIEVLLARARRHDGLVSQLSGEHQNQIGRSGERQRWRRTDEREWPEPGDVLDGLSQLFQVLLLDLQLGLLDLDLHLVRGCGRGNLAQGIPPLPLPRLERDSPFCNDWIRSLFASLSRKPATWVMNLGTFSLRTADMV